MAQVEQLTEIFAKQSFAPRWVPKLSLGTRKTFGRLEDQESCGPRQGKGLTCMEWVIIGVVVVLVMTFLARRLLRQVIWCGLVSRH